MIHFDHANSPFYETNKSYCLEFADKFRSQNVECNGFCTSYGYDVEATFTKNGLLYRTCIHKFQTTQSGGIFPVDANEESHTEIMITGLPSQYRITGGRSAFMRMLADARIKSLLPPPYYISFSFTPPNQAITSIVNLMREYSVNKLRLSGGEFHCKLVTRRADPLQLLISVDSVLQHLT